MCYHIYLLFSREFGLDRFDDPSKHLTSEDIGDITCDEFVAMFDAQYPEYPWSKIEVRNM